MRVITRKYPFDCIFVSNYKFNFYCYQWILPNLNSNFDGKRLQKQCYLKEDLWKVWLNIIHFFRDMLYTNFFGSYYFYHIFLFSKFASNFNKFAAEKFKVIVQFPWTSVPPTLADILCPMSENNTMALHFCFRFAHFLYTQVRQKFP